METIEFASDAAMEEEFLQAENRELRRRGNMIQVSSNKKPLYFYVNLAKRLIQQHDEVLLSALGMAISTVVIISEILKNNGFATEKKIRTSTVESKDNTGERIIQKPKIEILLQKSEKFNDLMTAVKQIPVKGAEVKDDGLIAPSEQESAITATSEEESGVTTTGSEEDCTETTPTASEG